MHFKFIFTLRVIIIIEKNTVFHVWTGAPSCCLEFLDKLQKRMSRTAGPSLAASLEILAHRQNVASLSLYLSMLFCS